MQAVGLHALHGFDVAVLCRALPEITAQFGRERVRDLRGLHGVVPLAKRRAYIPQLHGGKQCDPDGPAGQTRQPCERCQRQQVVDGPEQPPAGAKDREQLNKRSGQRQRGERHAVGGDDVADGKRGQHSADGAQRPVTAHSGQDMPPR